MYSQYLHIHTTVNIRYCIIACSQRCISDPVRGDDDILCGASARAGDGHGTVRGTWGP